MDPYPSLPRDYPTLGERLADAWQRGLRVARRMAVAFGLATALAIGVGAAVTDNAFAQVAVTILAAFGFWLPMLLLTVKVEQFLAGRRLRRARPAATAVATRGAGSSHWRRLAAAAPRERQRLLAVQKSLEASRLSFGNAELDPDAHDLCVLIDRRLPELIDRELDTLPPDDRGRHRQIGELVELVEQFARHCGRKRDGDRSQSAYQAEILKRRFQDRLAGPGPLGQ